MQPLQSIWGWARVSNIKKMKSATNRLSGAELNASTVHSTSSMSMWSCGVDLLVSLLGFL